MISFAVGDGGGSVGVGRKVVEFCGPIVRALWHGVLLAGWMMVSGRESVLYTVLVVVQVLLRDIVLRHLARSYLRYVRILGVLHTLYGSGFERVSLLY
jgi:hypothetical protein